MTTFFARNGDTITTLNGAAFESALPLGTYSLQRNPQTGQYYLSRVGDLSTSGKLYGPAGPRADRIFNTFTQRAGTTGVLLDGLKGTGKTALARRVSEIARSHGISTILIGEPFYGESFNKFIQSLGTCVFLFDEFEKVYAKPHEQAGILTMMDGTFQSKKLVVVTTNQTNNVSEFFMNRPGRLFYRYNYGPLSEELIREYCADVLKPEFADRTGAVVGVAEDIASFAMDMLIAIVEEVNRYGETVDEVMRVLNCRPDYSGGVRAALYDKTNLTKPIATALAQDPRFWIQAGRVTKEVLMTGPLPADRNEEAEEFFVQIDLSQEFKSGRGWSEWVTGCGRIIRFARQQAGSPQANRLTAPVIEAARNDNDDVIADAFN